MSKDSEKEEGDGTLPNWSRGELDDFHWRLKQLGSWSAHADKLFEHLAPLAPRQEEIVPISRGDESMLSLIVDDALRGTDIATRCPTFFNKLLTHSELRQAFIDSLELLQKNRAGQLTPLPGSPSQSLAFLWQEGPQVTVNLSASSQWCVVWRQPADQTQRIFTLTDLIADAIYRFEATFVGGDWITLFHDRAEVGESQLEIALEALQPVDQPMFLRLAATIVLTPAPEREEARERETIQAHGLQTTLKWGSYEETAVVDECHQAVFPPLPLELILDEAGETVNADLYLIVNLA